MANSLAPIPSWCCNTPGWKTTVDKSTGYITMEPEARHDNTLIFLHGLGEYSWDQFKNFTEMKAIPDNTKVIFPQAPKIKMSNSLTLTSWFDILPDQNPGKPYTDA